MSVELLGLTVVDMLGRDAESAAETPFSILLRDETLILLLDP